MIGYQLNPWPCLISGNVIEEKNKCQVCEQSNESKFLGYNLEGNMIFLNSQ